MLIASRIVHSFSECAYLSRLFATNPLFGGMNSKFPSNDCPWVQKVDLTPFPSLYREENIILHSLFKKYGYELRICGGAVRDVLLGIPPKDIDFATDATPTQMNEMFSKENVRTLNRNGEVHGTVTARINDQVNFEVTTLRIDVDPDGRHTKVIFTNDWKLDAERRDLTVNSMFLSVDVPDHLPEQHLGDSIPSPIPADTVPTIPSVKLSFPIFGHVYDYFNGHEDLAHRRIRFVGDPSIRIREDYLRILRYFRFHGRLAPASNVDTHDEASLKAIGDLCKGLSMVAGERCWVELRSILTYSSAPYLLRRMHDLGVFSFIGFPEHPDFEELDRLWARGVIQRNPDPVTCLSALLSTLDQVETLNDRLKLSNQEILTILFIIKHRAEFLTLAPEHALERYKRELLLSSLPANKLRYVLIQMMYYTGLNQSFVDEFSTWEPPKFPVSGLDLSEKWSLPKRELQRNLFALKRQWVESGCHMDPDDLLSEKTRNSLRMPDELPHQFEVGWMKKKTKR